MGQKGVCPEKSTRTRERQCSTKGLGGWYLERSEPINRGCGGDHVKKSTTRWTRRAQRAIMATMRAWIGSRPNPEHDRR